MTTTRRFKFTELQKGNPTFWRHVEKGKPDKCWEWQASKYPKGYGQAVVGKKHTLTHREAYRQAFGSIPEGLCVLHRCDNPPCCNPNHLFIGTLADNNRDMKEKGRHATGGKNGARKHRERMQRGTARHNARLTGELVSQIRTRYASVGAEA